MTIERVARQHDDIRAGAAGRAQDAGQTRRPVAAVQPRRIFMIHVHIGAVNDHDIAGRRRHCVGHDGRP